MSTAASAPLSWPVQRASELLDGLAREMRRAAKHPDADAVHDVRVAIRRLRQCLTVFAPVFPSRASENIHRKARKLLHAAGELRNLDIVIQLLRDSHLARTAPLISALRKHRGEAEKTFLRALAKLDDGGITGKWQATLSASSEQPASAIDADKKLPVLAAEFFAAGELAAEPMAGPKTQHKFRIKTKKFRYTIELFATLYGPKLNPLLRVLRNVQTRLGKMNDYVVSCAILRQNQRGHAAAVERAMKHLARKTAAESAGFRSYWHRALGAEQKGQWIRILSELKLEGVE